MDPKGIQDKVQAFTQRLLDEANGDPVRALGLLVIVLDGADPESADHIWQLVTEIRKVLLPGNVGEIGKPVQHFAGDVSWEGIQHCLLWEGFGEGLSRRGGSTRNGIRLRNRFPPYVRGM